MPKKKNEEIEGTATEETVETAEETVVEAAADESAPIEGATAAESDADLRSDAVPLVRLPTPHSNE